jgi:NitT/TauT family transport system permease protein
MSAVTSSALAGAAARPFSPRWRRAGLGALGIGVLMIVWFAATDLAGSPGSFLARFSLLKTVQALAHLAVDPEFLLHVAVSLQRIGVGLLIALLIGVPLGVSVGLSRSLDAATTPAFQLLRMISPLSWMPIAVMVFGVGDKPIYFLLAFAATWPVMLNTAAGVRSLDRRWMLLASSLAATRWETIRRVVIPGITGHVLTGARLSIGICWIILVPCEMLGVSAGLGYFILDTRDRLAYPELMATVLVIGVLGYMLDSAARYVQTSWARQPG